MLDHLPIQEIKPYADVESGLARIRGNANLYLRMLGLVLQSEEFEKLEQALQLSDYEAAANVAHAIKGISGNLSLTMLFDDGTALMNELRQGSPSEDTLAKYRDTLERTLAVVQDIVRQPDNEG